MGLNYGILAIKAPLNNIIDKLYQLNVFFEKKGNLYSFPSETLSDEGWIIPASEIDNYSIIMDSSFVLSGAQNPDLIVALSRYFKEPIVSCGAETVSGSYWFLSVCNSKIIRFYEHCHMSISVPFSIGDILPTESKLPFNGDLYGNGLFEGLKYFGYDVVKWLAQFPKISFFYKINNYYNVTLDNHSLGHSLKNHHDKYKLSSNKKPGIKIVSEIIGNEAIFNITTKETKKKNSIFDRFRNLFK
jgi:hypothetical protein